MYLLNYDQNCWKRQYFSDIITYYYVWLQIFDMKFYMETTLWANRIRIQTFIIRIRCSIDNLIRLIYILKENNLQNINPICETNPPNIYIPFNSYKRQSHPNSIVEFLQIKNIKIAITLYISYRVPRQYPNTSLCWSSPGLVKTWSQRHSRHTQLPATFTSLHQAPTLVWSGSGSRSAAWLGDDSERKYKTSTTARLLELVGVSL